jgi:methylated-DNA-[protein]-cysteine S-methyltransferase
MSEMHCCYLKTPAGYLRIRTDATAVCEVSFQEKPGISDPVLTPLLKKARQELTEYFAGTRQSFDLPLCPSGTAFQQRIWQVLQTIPYGTTISYQQEAEAAGSPHACRAAGGANGANPIVILIPCHRVIRADGSLGGYSAGLQRKAFLLQLEQSRR